MNKTFRKISSLILTAILILLLSGCAQFNSEYQIYQDGEYSFKTELLIPESLSSLPDVNIDELVEYLKTSLKLEDDLVINEIGREVNGIAYTGVEIIREKGPVLEGGAVTIDFDRAHAEMVFTLNNPDLSDIFFTFVPLSEGTDQQSAMKSYEEMGMSVKFVFNMPGEILSTSGGVINGNSVEFSLIDNSLRTIIIRSKYPGLTYLQIGMISGGAIIIAVLGSLYFYKKKRVVRLDNQALAIKPDMTDDFHQEKDQLLAQFYEDIKNGSQTKKIKLTLDPHEKKKR